MTGPHPTGTHPAATATAQTGTAQTGTAQTGTAQTGTAQTGTDGTVAGTGEAPLPARTGRGRSAGRRVLSAAVAVAVPAAVIAVLLVLWELAIEAFDVRPFVLAKPSAIWDAFAEKPDVYIEYGFNTLREAVQGLAFGVAVGVAVAVATFRSKLLSELARAYSAALLALPVVAVIPLSNVFFGLQPASRVFVVAVGTTPIMLTYTLTGLKATDAGLAEMFRACAMPRWRSVLSLFLPSALPYFISGVRVALPSAFSVAIIGEYFGGERNTLGTYIKTAAVQSKVADLWGAAMTAFLFAVALFALVALADRLLLRWHPSRARRG
ncbi:ABC transporter permease [Parafrankia sp. EUN1f]|uniref:ABC transporter permease n=1 Tax=Parafrankia sp. EUN1f TaxID=102897 RepID=UPI001E494606|nr:ABC transporter permease subunit [Parafrankia sp. EUN1f]